MSPSQMRQLLLLALHLCSTCTALPLEQFPPRDEPINVPPGGSVLVSARVSGYMDTNSFWHAVAFDGSEPDVVRPDFVYMDQSLSYYEAEKKNESYVITAWRQNGSQCAEIAARVFNLPDLEHHNITVVFILNRGRNEINQTRFDINLLELPPTTTLESSTVAETTHMDDITTSWSPSSSLPTVSSIAVVSSSATGTPGSVADAVIFPPGATAAVAVSAAVAVGSVVCAVTVVAVVLTRSRRHKKTANPEAGANDQS